MLITPRNLHIPSKASGWRKKLHVRSGGVVTAGSPLRSCHRTAYILIGIPSWLKSLALQRARQSAKSVLSSINSPSVLQTLRSHKFSGIMKLQAMAMAFSAYASLALAVPQGFPKACDDKQKAASGSNITGLFCNYNSLLAGCDSNGNLLTTNAHCDNPIRCEFRRYLDLANMADWCYPELQN